MLIVLNGSYFSWNKYGAPGPEVLIVFYAIFQWLIWKLAKNGKLNAAFGIPLVWGLLELGFNLILLVASGQSKDVEIPDHLRNDFPYADVSQVLGLIFAVMLVVGHFWMAGAMWKYMTAQIK